MSKESRSSNIQVFFNEISHLHDYQNFQAQIFWFSNFLQLFIPVQELFNSDL